MPGGDQSNAEEYANKPEDESVKNRPKDIAAEILEYPPAGFHDLLTEAERRRLEP